MQYKREKFVRSVNAVIHMSLEIKIGMLIFEWDEHLVHHVSLTRATMRAAL